MSCLSVVEGDGGVATASSLMTAVVVGVGVVGGALADSLVAVGNEVLRHDPPQGLRCGDRFGDADVFFVCVPTPYDPSGGVDLNMVREAIRSLPTGVPVVLRSTMLPGTTAALQRDFPDHPLLHAPEFLTEDSAAQDELYPARTIVGYTRKSKRWADAVLQMMPSAPYERIVESSHAEMIKYFANVFYALSVSYVNQMFDLCDSTGVDYELVREAAEADPMMSSSHLAVWHKGYRGYGGKCLPKDTRALLTLAESLGVDLGIVAVAQRYNDRLVNHEPEAHRPSHHPECGPCSCD